MGQEAFRVTLKENKSQCIHENKKIVYYFTVTLTSTTIYNKLETKFFPQPGPNLRGKKDSVNFSKELESKVRKLFITS